MIYTIKMYFKIVFNDGKIEPACYETEFDSNVNIENIFMNNMNNIEKYISEHYDNDNFIIESISKKEYDLIMCKKSKK